MSYSLSTASIDKNIFIRFLVVMLAEFLYVGMRNLKCTFFIPPYFFTERIACNIHSSAPSFFFSFSFSVAGKTMSFRFFHISAKSSSSYLSIMPWHSFIQFKQQCPYDPWLG